MRKESQSNEPSGWAYRKKPISHFPTCILGAPSIGQLEKVDIGFDGSLPSEQLFGRSSSSTTNTPKNTRRHVHKEEEPCERFTQRLYFPWPFWLAAHSLYAGQEPAGYRFGAALGRGKRQQLVQSLLKLFRESVVSLVAKTLNFPVCIKVIRDDLGFPA